MSHITNCQNEYENQFNSRTEIHSHLPLLWNIMEFVPLEKRYQQNMRSHKLKKEVSEIKRLLMLLKMLA